MPLRTRLKGYNDAMPKVQTLKGTKLWRTKLWRTLALSFEKKKIMESRE